MAHRWFVTNDDTARCSICDIKDRGDEQPCLTDDDTEDDTN